MSDNTTLKRCSKCGLSFPATPEYFYRHKSYKDGLHYDCKPCANMGSRKYQANHKAEAVKRVRQWRKDNPGRRREADRIWREQNRDKERARNRKRYTQHPDKVKEANKQWADRNPIKILAKLHRRRARKHGAIGTHTEMDIIILRINQHGKCAYCSQPLKKYHVDHVIPLSRGGSDDFDNLALACPHCNQSKGNKLLSEWRH